ncbi:MAG: hypothetical protein WCV67_01060 [Victivallaceae bacterium]|jgi:hypothetical protein
MRKRRVFGSNTFRLSFKELAVTGAIIIIGVLFLLPYIWGGIEKIRTGNEFRIAYDSRDDYWVYKKWADKAAEEYPVIFLGDSVVWGMYVDSGSTLSAKLNRKLNRQAVANLAIDGMHSVALEGLLKYYGGAIKNKTVILHYNPLWMNSRKYDLSDDEEMQVHHPRLIPQFSPKYKCYTESFSGRLNICRERNIPFFSLLNHIRLAFFNNEELNQWMIDNPYKTPFSQISMTVDPCEKEKTNSSENWKQKGITAQEWEWVPLDKSYQWQAFTNVVKLLRERGNRVCVMVGPLNPYMLTPASLVKFRKLQQDICAWLSKQNVEYMLVPDLPSEMYADASHPLDKGYDVIADNLLKTSFLDNNINQGAVLCSVKK